MKTICGIQVPESVSEMLANHEWSQRHHELSVRKSNDFINYADRSGRCYDAAEEGADGSTHAEHIEDFREFGSTLFGELELAIEKSLETDDPTNGDEMELFEQASQAYQKSCDDLEEWHETNGSLNQQIG